MPDLSVLMSSVPSVPKDEQLARARARIREVQDQYEKQPKVESEDADPFETTWALLDEIEAALKALHDIPPRDEARVQNCWDARDQLVDLSSQDIGSKGSDEERHRVDAFEDLRERIMKIPDQRLAEIEAAAETLSLRAGTPEAAAFGKFLRALREEKELSAKELGDKLEKTPAYIRMLEQGARVAAADTYTAYLDEMGLKVTQDGRYLLRVPDGHGREVRIVLLPAATKADLIAGTSMWQVKQAKRTAGSTAITDWLTQAGLTAGAGKDTTSSEPIMREVLMLLAQADEHTLRHVRDLLTQARQPNWTEE